MSTAEPTYKPLGPTILYRILKNILSIFGVGLGALLVDHVQDVALVRVLDKAQIAIMVIGVAVAVFVVVLLLRAFRLIPAQRTNPLGDLYDFVLTAVTLCIPGLVLLLRMSFLRLGFTLIMAGAALGTASILSIDRVYSDPVGQ